MKAIVVEDEPWMLKRFRMECDGVAGLDLISSFQSPLDALRFARTHRIELAFLDVEMPEMNGFELAGKLRALWPEIIVVFISAHDKYMEKALRTGVANYYITKPYDSDDIRAAVDEARTLLNRMRKRE
ncbi:MAG: response regulator [Clostridia bacterium]|nr:response regulator [Clostridia bacterium]